ncbi:MAG: zinc-dependent metalloprotease family protein, partial [Gracilimonas sp.]|nr:zinc-dependent metalloprotease family protein [Gracilimonas sp.]
MKPKIISKSIYFMTLKAKGLLIIFFVLFGFSSFSVAQDFVFTSQISKTTGEKVYEVQINEDRVLNSLDKGEQLTLELDGSSFLQTIKGKNKVGFGYTAITGHPKQGNSYSNLLLKEGKLSGIIHFEGIPYRIQAKNGDYQFFKINDEIHACSFDDLPMNRASQQKSFFKAGGEYANPVYDIEDYNDTTTVDVLVLYTSRAKEWASGANNTHTNDIQEIFALNESFKNNIISNSKLTLKIRFLDHIEIANTPENNSLNKLNDLVDNTYTGNPDTVDIHSLRDQFGADLVALVDSINDTGGIAYRPNGVGGSPSSGYSVNRVQQIGFSYTLMHEIGHNFGNAHGRTQNSNAATDFGGIFQFST